MIEEIIKRFRDKFVEIIDGRPYIVTGTANEFKEFIREEIIGYREGDISAWKNYGEKRGYFKFFDKEVLKGERQRIVAQIREEAKQRLIKRFESHNFSKERYFDLDDIIKIISTDR